MQGVFRGSFQLSAFSFQLPPPALEEAPPNPVPVPVPVPVPDESVTFAEWLRVFSSSSGSRMFAEGFSVVRVALIGSPSTCVEPARPHGCWRLALPERVSL